ncbi:hypothetical protein PV327_002511 [Microctonus hyperodae]|uniref:Uncharacterized protein n=1 Tax=Microctonus hyperodae TaxID=165561 RepID=A0AA39FFU8_MICHY|nr:hypothetical protein PV327_002511 [Microctonus hyperodae]
MDRTEAAPLTSERRYGIFRAGLVTAFILIVVLVGAAIALLFGIRDATILLGILLPLMLLTAMIAHLWFWWLHRRASRQREHAANEWVSATLSRQTNSVGSTQSPGSNNSSSDVWFKRAPQRTTSGYTPPPGYHIVQGN